MIQVMHDVETMSTEPNAAICSIGAVKFDEDRIVDSFYRTIESTDCKALGLHFSQSTIDWWAKQPRETLAALRKDTQNLHPVMVEYCKWYGPSSLPTWGNGSDFDNVIIGNAMKVVGINTPWKFWHNRCYRTMAAVFDIPKGGRTGVLHNALSDATFQAEHLIRIFKS